MGSKLPPDGKKSSLEESDSIPAMAAFLELYPDWEGFHCSTDGDGDQHPNMWEMKILLECGWA